MGGSASAGDGGENAAAENCRTPPTRTPLPHLDRSTTEPLTLGPLQEIDLRSKQMSEIEFSCRPCAKAGSEPAVCSAGGRGRARAGHVRLCARLRHTHTIWWLDTLRGLDGRLGGASSDRQDHQRVAETAEYVPRHGARALTACQREPGPRAWGGVCGSRGRAKGCDVAG